MNGVELAVLAGGVGVIGLLYWFFFGLKEAAPKAAAPHTGGARTDLVITGMTCAACVSRVEKAARRVPGVTDAAVNLLANPGMFRYDPALTSPPVIAAAIEKIGFEAAPLTPDAPKADHTAAAHALARRFWTAALLTLPVVVGAMGGAMRGQPSPPGSPPRGRSSS